MKLTYSLGSQFPGAQVIPSLTKAAHMASIELELIADGAADLHFYSPSEIPAERTGIKVLVEGTHESADISLNGEVLNLQTAQVLLAWVKERHELMAVSPLRHELGNLVVILLGRVLRLKQEQIGEEHMTSLESLHQRFTNLYHDFDRVKVPRY